MNLFLQGSGECNSSEATDAQLINRSLGQALMSLSQQALGVSAVKEYIYINMVFLGLFLKNR